MIFGQKCGNFDHGSPSAANLFQIRKQHCVSSNGKTVVPRKRLNMNQSFSRIQVEKAVQIYSNKFKQVQQSSKRIKTCKIDNFRDLHCPFQNCSRTKFAPNNSLQMGNAETLPLSQAKQDIGYVAIVLRRTNKVRIIYDTPQTKSVLCEIVRYVVLEFVK